MPVLSIAPATRRSILLFLLSLGMVIAYIDRINLSVALSIKDFTRHFVLTDNDRGALNSAFFWTYALAQPTAGWIVDRYGSKYPFAAGFLLWSMVSAATAWVGSVWQLFALRLLLGLAEAIVTPASMRWIRFQYAEQSRGLALGIYTTGSKIGSAIAAPLTVWLIKAYGWQGMFLLLGFGCLIWLVFWLPLAEDDHRRVATSATPAEPALSFAALLSAPATWGIIIGAFCYSYFYMFYMTWLPAYLIERRGLTPAQMSFYTAASFAGMALVVAPAGWLSDRLVAKGYDAVRVRRGFTIAGMLFASSELIGAFSNSNQVALAFAVISMAGLGLTTANYWALTQALIPRSSIGRVIGLQNCSNSISGIVAAILTGWLKTVTGSYEAPMLAIVVFLLIGVAAYYSLARERFAPATPTLPYSPGLEPLPSSRS